jgi:hypothetical protein
MFAKIIVLVLSALFSSGVSEKYPSFFLPAKYSDLWGRRHFRVKQVPGDGACLFNAIAVSAQYIHSGKHSEYSDTTARLASALRACAVARLSNNDSLLLISGQEFTSCENLLVAAALEFNVSQNEYLKMMKLPQTWGGGPEIVALSNTLKRPIHVYTTAYNKLLPFRFYIKKQICFGPADNVNSNDNYMKYSDRIRPICILYTDGRFPLVKPWKDELNFDHFLALFDTDDQDCDTIVRESKRTLLPFNNACRGAINKVRSIGGITTWTGVTGFASRIILKFKNKPSETASGSTQTANRANDSNENDTVNALFNYSKNESDAILKTLIENSTAIPTFQQ